MRVRIATELKTLEGQPLHNGNDGVPLTLRYVCCGALLAPGDQNDERLLSGEEKVRRFKLAQRLVDVDEVDLSPEELTLLRQLIAKNYFTLVVGQAWELLG